MTGANKSIFREFMQRKGLKSTRQRDVILDAFLSMEHHSSTEELYLQLRQRDPNIGYATVYRTLKLLLDRGLVCRIVMGDGSVSYRASHKAHHHHIVCVSCGATEDVHMNDVEDVLAGVRGATDYDIVGHRIEVYGLCPACKSLQAT